MQVVISTSECMLSISFTWVQINLLGNSMLTFLTKKTGIQLIFRHSKIEESCVLLELVNMDFTFCLTFTCRIGDWLEHLLSGHILVHIFEVLGAPLYFAVQQWNDQLQGYSSFVYAFCITFNILFNCLPLLIHQWPFGFSLFCIIGSHLSFASLWD